MITEAIQSIREALERSIEILNPVGNIDYVCGFLNCKDAAKVNVWNAFTDTIRSQADLATWSALSGNVEAAPGNDEVSDKIRAAALKNIPQGDARVKAADELQAKVAEVRNALRAINRGYGWKIEYPFIKVENPKFQPDNGENIYLVLELANSAPQIQSAARPEPQAVRECPLCGVLTSTIESMTKPCPRKECPIWTDAARGVMG